MKQLVIAGLFLALAAAQARLRLYGLQDRLLGFMALVEVSNFVGAQGVSSTSSMPCGPRRFSLPNFRPLGPFLRSEMR